MMLHRLIVKAVKKQVAAELHAQYRITGEVLDILETAHNTYAVSFQTKEGILMLEVKVRILMDDFGVYARIVSLTFVGFKKEEASEEEVPQTQPTQPKTQPTQPTGRPVFLVSDELAHTRKGGGAALPVQKGWRLWVSGLFQVPWI